MFVSDRLTDPFDDLRGILRLAVKLLNHDEAFFAGGINRESGPTSRSQCGVATLNRQFDVLWIMIVASDDNQVFEPAGHKEFVVFEEPQVAGSAKRPAPVIR